MSFNAFVPAPVTEGVLVSSNLPEDDYPVWNAGTNYAAGARVTVTTISLAKATDEAWAAGQDIYWSAALSLATVTTIAGAFIGTATAAVSAATATGSVSVHKVYQDVQNSNTNHNPVTDAVSGAAWWVPVGSTNRWRPFDRNIFEAAESAGNITYSLLLSEVVTGVALFGLNAASITLELLNTSAAVVTTQTLNLTDTSAITDWYEFYTWQPAAVTKALFTDFSGFPGYTLNITLSGTNTRLGALALGRVVSLGIAKAGTEVGFRSYSRKDTDEFGQVMLVRRPTARTMTAQFAVPVNDMDRVADVIADLNDQPTVWYAAQNRPGLGALVFGIVAGDGFRAPLEVEGYHQASVEILGFQ